jgi:hypothetical protein
MKTVLDSAHTWFFESLVQDGGGSLAIRLVEGIKGATRRPVEVSGTDLGQFFPVMIERHSRCAVIHFANALELFTYDESFDTADPTFQGESGRAFIRQAQASSFRAFACARTTLLSVHTGPLLEFLIWSEDRVFQVFAAEEPEVAISDRGPDLTIERAITWSAS